MQVDLFDPTSHLLDRSGDVSDRGGCTLLTEDLDTL